MKVTATDNLHIRELESANVNFEMFRRLHRLDDPQLSTGLATLKGDYYFSRFSLDLIPVDSVEITDRFARILREDASGCDSPELPAMSFDDPKTFANGRKLLERQLKSVCQTDNRKMRLDLERILLSGGKRLRPALAQAAYGLGNEKKYPVLPLMVMIELMHSASLIHDDVVDQGQIRRGVATINHTSGDLDAVRSADFILGRAMELLKVYRGSGIDERLAHVSEQMCIGELKQMEYLNRDIDEETYFSLITMKTALFIEASAACGAIAGGCSEDVVRCMEQYGLNIGIAFQIRDDILDYTGKERLGKETGQDARKGLKTLPVITGLDKARKKVEEYSETAICAIQGIKEGVSVKALTDMARQLERREI